MIGVFDNPNKVDEFKTRLNKMHGNLEFTHEIGPNSIAFLDTEISLPGEQGPANSTVYRKPTNTGVLLNFSALCPSKWKIGMMTCFISRAYTVCSTWDLFYQEIDKLRTIFRNNGYPKKYSTRPLIRTWKRNETHPNPEKKKKMDYYYAFHT